VSPELDTDLDETSEEAVETEPGTDDDTEDTEDTEDGEDADGAEDTEDGGDSSELINLLEREGDIAADYLEELLDIADLDGDLDMDVEGDRAAVSIVGADLAQLVGRDGEVLEALQELTRLAVYRETGERSRLMLDISGHRADKRVRLEKLADEKVAEVRASGERVELEPMTAFERKVVHDAVAAAGLTSESEGTDPRRFVVILPE
jgi:spoIIIJ-associated protein